MNPERLGPYVVLSVMGQGGTGVVTKCRHERTGGLLAVKHARDTSALQRDLMRKEVSMLSRLGRSGHPAVVRVVESGSDGGLFWYAMEFVDGPDLGAVFQFFQRGVMPDTSAPTPGPRVDTTVHVPYRPEPSPTWVHPHLESPRHRGEPDSLTAALEVMKRVAQSVAFIHEEGVIHADLKPKNLLFREDGSSVVVDFGAALYMFAGSSQREVAQVERRRHGTPGYMAPEQILGESLDTRCDLYALGCILFEAVTGRRPFEGNDVRSLYLQHLRVPPVPPSQLVAGVPSEIDALVLGLLAKDPRKRVGYVEDVVSTLGAVLGDGESDAGGSPRHVYRARVAGRASELERLQALLAAARDGQGGVAYVVGESGIGKTRVINELGGIAIDASMDVVVGQCLELSQSGRSSGVRGSVLQPFIPLFHHVIDRCSVASGSALAQELVQPLAALAPYESGLLELPPVAAHHLSELPHALARARVFRSLTQVLERLGRERPLLVLLDDLHWADDLSVAYLRSEAARGLRSARVLLLGTFRDEQVDEDLRLTAEVEPPSLVRLARLDLRAMRSMLRDMLASELVPEGLDELLHRHSEGNPFFAAEYLRAALGRGVVARQAGEGWVAPLLTLDRASRVRDSLPPPLPAALLDLIQLRLDGLSEPALRLMQLAAVLGREIELERLEAFHGDLEQRAMSVDALALEELMARQILEDRGQNRYRFVHDKLREAAEASIPQHTRQSLHAAAARGIESAAQGVRDTHFELARLGHHWANAGAPSRALAYLENAALAATKLHANAEAIDLHLVAIRQAELLPAEIESPRLARLGESLADLYVRVARHAEARRYYDWVRSLLDPGDRLSSARTLRKKAQSYWTVHEYGQATEALARASRELGETGPDEGAEFVREWVEVQLGHFWSRYFARQTGPATQAIIAQMRETVERAAQPVQRSEYYVCAALDVLARSRYGPCPEAVEFTRRAVEVVAPDAAYLAQATLARFNLGFALVLWHREAQVEAMQHLEQTASDAERLGDVTLHARALTYLTIVHRRLGDVDATARVGERARATSEAARLAPYIGATLGCLGWVQWKRGDRAEARRLLQEARSWWSSSGHDFPFRWVAILPSLALELEQRGLASVRAGIIELLQPNQQDLPRELADELTRASCADDDQALSAAVMNALTAAEKLGYC
jgi:eukaryotic-like serine/threonine-protein kinase